MAGMPGRKFTITIQKNERGRWVVANPKERAIRGEDAIEWVLVSDSPSVSAHFQFTYPKGNPLFKPKRGLTRDQTAKIIKPADRLTLEIHGNADRRKNPHHYAVWISDKNHPEGGSFAVGESLNPPPELNIGP